MSKNSIKKENFNVNSEENLIELKLPIIYYHECTGVLAVCRLRLYP